MSDYADAMAEYQGHSRAQNDLGSYPSFTFKPYVVDAGPHPLSGFASAPTRSAESDMSVVALTNEEGSSVELHQAADRLCISAVGLLEHHFPEFRPISAAIVGRSVVCRFRGGGANEETSQLVLESPRAPIDEVLAALARFERCLVVPREERSLGDESGPATVRRDHVNDQQRPSAKRTDANGVRQTRRDKSSKMRNHR